MVPNHQPDILLFQLLAIINHRLTIIIHVPVTTNQMMSSHRLTIINHQI